MRPIAGALEVEDGDRKWLVFESDTAGVERHEHEARRFVGREDVSETRAGQRGFQRLCGGVVVLLLLGKLRACAWISQ
jgi:hypothetical protein